MASWTLFPLPSSLDSDAASFVFKIRIFSSLELRTSTSARASSSAACREPRPTAIVSSWSWSDQAALENEERTSGNMMLRRNSARPFRVSCKAAKLAENGPVTEVVHTFMFSKEKLPKSMWNQQFRDSESVCGFFFVLVQRTSASLAERLIHLEFLPLGGKTSRLSQTSIEPTFSRDQSTPAAVNLVAVGDLFWPLFSEHCDRVATYLHSTP